MNRRLFFQRVFGTVAAATLAPFLPIPTPKHVELAFHPDAFAFAMNDIALEDFRARYIKPAVTALADDIDKRISMRFIQQFDVESSRMVNKMDVLYGVGVIAPHTLVRVD